MRCFSCFNPSTTHDPSEDNYKTAIKLSRHEEEDRIVRLRREKDEQVEIERAKEESLKLAKEEEEKRRLEEESKEKGKSKQVDHDDQVEDKGQIEDSKDKDDNPPPPLPPPSICNGCKSEIKDGSSVNAFGDLWHPECVCCLHCHKPVAMDEISRKGKFHRPCYKEHRYPNCYVCKNKFPSTEKGREYKEHPFWKEKYCPCHEDDGTAKCCSCERLEPRGTNYVMLGDDRWLCLECMGSSVMDTDESVSLHMEIREFFEGLFLKVEKEFPLLLVEKQALNKAEEEEKIDYHHAVVTRGLCLSEEQTVTSVKKRPKMGPNNMLVDMVTETQTVDRRRCEVTAILIVYGLPRLLTGSILSHEMMHAWLRLNGYKKLKIELEEGLCQVLALRWLESQTFASTDAAAASSSSRTPPAVTTSKKNDDWSDYEKKLLKFCMYQIKEDDSPVYGLGFKQVYEMMVLNHDNLKDTLKDIVRDSNI